MADARTYPSGVPCWIDTEQPDPVAARHFYGTLFGWTFEEAMPPGAPGSYLIAQLDGHDVAAIAPSAEQHAVWSTYIAVDDADDVVRVVTREGGVVTAPAQDAGPGGRSAAFVDPAGAPFRVWQPRRRLGAQVVNAPGAWNFSDLHTSDTAAARDFYGRVFGWEADDLDLGGGPPATMWRRPGWRSSRGHRRPGHSPTPGGNFGAPGVRRRDRVVGRTRARRGAALARHLCRCRPR